MILYIDVSHCNLHCKMCPVGDVRGLRKSTAGLMSLDLFKRIADKIVIENVTIDAFYIGNWGEALLNPDVWKIILYAKNNLHPKQILVNSNMSLKIPDPELLLMSGITDLRGSLSGMTQDVYVRNHVGGSVEKVLGNLSMLNALKKELGLTLPRMAMVYHEYLYNEFEKPLAIDFCHEHNLEFMPIRCYPCSVEEGMKFHQDFDARKTYKEFIDLEGEISRMRTIPEDQPCALTDQIIINFNGDAFKCCGTYSNKNSLGNFFDWKIVDLLAHYPKVCSVCKSIPLSWR